MKTIGQLLRDFSCFAPFDPRCGFQMALCVKGKWKQREGSDKYYPGQPETAHMHKIFHSAQIEIGLVSFRFTRRNWES
jgi:hypothetical protein